MKFPKCIITLLVAFFFAVPAVASAATFYVDNAVSTSGDGTSWVRAWKSFTNINWNSIQPGDTVYISGGSTSKTYSETLTIGKGGTGNNARVMIRSGQDSGHNGIVIIEKGLASNKPYVDINGEYQGTRHLVVKSSGVCKECVAVSLGGSTDPLLRYVEVATAGIGVEFTSGNRGEFAYNYIHDIRGDAGMRFNATNGVASQYDLTFVHHNIIQLNSMLTAGDGPDGIQGTRGLTVHDNRIYNALGPLSPDGTNHADLIQVQALYVKIYNNLFEDVTDSAIDLDYWDGGALGHWMIYNNVLKFNGQTACNRCIRVYSTGEPITSFEDIHIYSNTFVDARTANVIGINVGQNGNPTVSNVHIKNNIFYNTGGTSILIGASSNANQSDWNVDYNLIYPFSSASSIIVDGIPYTQTHGSTELPRFVSYQERNSSNNLRLVAQDTAALNKGTNLSALFAADKDGVTRPQGSAWDIGAYEYGGSVGGGTPQNQSPAVSITSPTNGQNYPTATAAVTVNVSALDVDGVDEVHFYDGNVFYGRDDDASCENGGTSCSYPSSFSFTFGDLTAGAGGAAVSHTLRAVAYDNQGASASAAVIITVGTLMGSGYKSATGGSSDVPPCNAPTGITLDVTGPCPVLSVRAPTPTDTSVTIGLAVQPRQYVWNTIFVTDISNPKIKKWIPKTIPSCGTDGWCTSSDGTGHTLTLTPTALSALGGTGVHYVASWDWTWNGTCWLGPGATACDTPGGKWRVQKFEVE